MVATGVGFAGFASFWPLLLVAFVGTLNPSSGDVSVFLPLEHARLAHAAHGEARAALFARYSALGAIFAALGALAAAAPDGLVRSAGIAASTRCGDVPRSTRAIGALVCWLYRRLPAGGADGSTARAPRRSALRGAIVVRLAALFSVDAFAGGLVVNSLLSLWLYERFGLSLAQAGAFFFWTGLLSAASQFAAPMVARRIGLLNTMVFTHIPANVCLIAAALAPSLPLALALLFVAQRALADGRADAHGLRHGGRHACGAHRRGELHGGAAQPRRRAQPGAQRRALRRRLAGAAAGGLRRAQDRLRPRRSGARCARRASSRPDGAAPQPTRSAS